MGPDPDHRYNAHVVVDGRGEIKASYRKIHLFDVNIPNGPLLMESKTAAPGQGEGGGNVGEGTGTSGNLGLAALRRVDVAFLWLADLSGVNLVCVQ